MADEPMTREEVRAEVGRAMHDPTHPQHMAYQKALPSFGVWADGLYKRIPGLAQAAPLMIDEAGIEVTGAPAPARAGTSSPGRMTPKMIRGEAAKIMAEPGWARQDPALMAKMDKLYRDHYGSAPVDLTDGIEVGATPGPSARGEPVAISAEDRAANEAAMEELRSEWGEKFDARFELARQQMQSLEDEHGVDALEGSLGVALAAGINRAQILKYLAGLAGA